MIHYEDLIMDLLAGDTPKQKYNNLVKMKNLLSEIAYPKRGTIEESRDIYHFANEIIEQKLISNE